jgi:Zn-dependent protease
VNRGDPQQGVFLFLILVLALQLSRGHDLPPGRQIVYFLASFIIATTIHEFMHAYSAFRLGDTTARDLGRITLNPASHFEPYGLFGMVMISLGFSFIGWGKPVPVNPNRLRGVIGKGVDARKRAMAVVALAGPVSNITQAGIASGLIHLADRNGTDLGEFRVFLGIFFIVNVLLASFNLIPIPPLDGHKILLGILPNFWYPVLMPLERYGFMILFAIFYVPDLLNAPSLDYELIGPMYELLIRIFY